ncbi:MAG: hypothetical protein JSV61_08585 [Anaerolineales bacterium]|nr:MAG: hypothetical protein JSV61_08585 [Anaerolineales bacterium]
MSVVIETECSHCGQEMRIEVDSDLEISYQEAGTKPLVFMPDVQWDKFTEQNIIDVY